MSAIVLHVIHPLCMPLNSLVPSYLSVAVPKYESLTSWPPASEVK